MPQSVLVQSAPFSTDQIIQILEDYIHAYLKMKGRKWESWWDRTSFAIQSFTQDDPNEKIIRSKLENFRNKIVTLRDEDINKDINNREVTEEELQLKAQEKFQEWLTLTSETRGDADKVKNLKHHFHIPVVSTFISALSKSEPNSNKDTESSAFFHALCDLTIELLRLSADYGELFKAYKEILRDKVTKNEILLDDDDGTLAKIYEENIIKYRLELARMYGDEKSLVKLREHPALAQYPKGDLALKTYGGAEKANQFLPLFLQPSYPEHYFEKYLKTDTLNSWGTFINMSLVNANNPKQLYPTTPQYRHKN